MIGSNPFLQNCLGISAIVVAIGSSWSMISGAMVKVSVAGTYFSVNEKLQVIEKVTDNLSQTAKQLKAEPGASHLKLQVLEQDLKLSGQQIEDTEAQINRNLEQLINPLEQ